MGREGLKPPYHYCNLHETPLSPSYKFEKEEEGGEGLEEEEEEAAPPVVIPASATACTLIIVSQARSSSTITRALMDIKLQRQKEYVDQDTGRCQLTLENYPTNLQWISKMYWWFSLLWTRLCLTVARNW